MNILSVCKRAWGALVVLLFVFGCTNDVDKGLPPQGDLHEVVFHAGWDPETKTVLQEDLSIWWSPGDEISLFVKSENGYNDNSIGQYGYKLTSTNIEPTANVEFVGTVNEQLSNASFVAIYPFYEYNSFSNSGGCFRVPMPSVQEACEGSFNKNLFVSVAVSDDDHLYFRNVCGGFRFSVENEGIDKIAIETFSDDEYVSGQLAITPSLEVSWLSWSRYNKVEIIAPGGETFVPGTYYYAVLPAMDYHGFKITYFKGNKAATYKDRSVITIKKSTFKRLDNKDAGLTFVKIPERKARLTHLILPEGVDKTAITEAVFHVNTDIETETIIGDTQNGYEPVYFEQNGTVVNYYTKGEVYELDYAGGMFREWTSLRRLDLSSFNTENSWSFGDMFYGCSSLENLDITSFNTEKCSDFTQMFYGCSSLESLDLTSFNTENGSSFSGMFGYCSSLKILDLSHFDTSHASSMRAMFAECRNLRTLNLTGWTPKATEYQQMFYRCINLTQVDVSGFDFNTTVSSKEMFRDCHLLSRIDADNWTSSTITDMSEMFLGCRSLSSLDISGLDLSNVDDMQCMFDGCMNLSELRISNSRTAVLKPRGIESMFADCQKLKSLDLSNFDTSGVTDMSLLFYQCYSLESLDLSGWNTSEVTDIKWMFLGCNALQQIDLSGFDTRNVTNLSYAFSGCSNLRNLDLSQWNTSQVTDMSYAFQGCNKLERLDISGFSSDRLQNAEYMFGHTYKLSAVNMGNLDLSPVSSQSLFYDTAIHTPNCYFRCTPRTRDAIEQSNPGFDNVVWITDGTALPNNIPTRDESLYYSTDYSKDRTVRVVQRASEGAGIDLVLMGDGYSDRLIAAGDYDQDMEYTVDCIFKYEPFKSFKHLFNIYITYVVSENEIIGKSTALATDDTRSNAFGAIGSNDLSCIDSYLRCASGKGDRRDIVPIVVLNSNGWSDGAAYNILFTSAEGEVFDYHNDLNWDDYHGGVNTAFVSGPRQPDYEGTVIHEFGHAFGILADEYWDDDNYQISDQTKANLQEMFPYGLWKNIDVTNDPLTIKWNHFLSDPRYANSGTGVFEGGNGYFGKGIWRPSFNSIMRNDMTGQFNAPSREAIYYRIHKLAYGKDWEYNFEDFVQWDLKNIQYEAEASLRFAPGKPLTRRPFLKIEESITADARKMITIIMN